LKICPANFGDHRRFEATVCSCTSLLVYTMSNVKDGDEVRTSADMTGAALQAKLATIRKDNAQLTAKEGTGKVLTAAEKKKRKMHLLTSKLQLTKCLTML